MSHPYVIEVRKTQILKVVRSPVTGNYRLPLFHGVPISREPYIAESSAWSQTLRRHRLPQRTWKFFAARSSGWPELATLWPKVAKI